MSSCTCSCRVFLVGLLLFYFSQRQVSMVQGEVVVSWDMRREDQ